MEKESKAIKSTEINNRRHRVSRYSRLFVRRVRERYSMKNQINFKTKTYEKIISNIGSGGSSCYLMSEGNCI